MKKREKLYPLVLALTALFLFLIIFSSTALAANNENALVFQGNYEEAIKVYDKAIENNSQNSEAWYNKGLCLAELGNYEEAIKAFDKAIEITPQNTDALDNKGYYLECLGNYEEAIKAFDKAIEINSQNSYAWCNKGLCLGYLGNYEEAVKAFDKAIDINSQDSKAWYNKGYSLECLGNYEEAIKAFDKAIDINSQYLDAWYNKGYSLECLGNYEEAVKAFDKAIDINSQDSDTWYNKGTCLAHLGKYNEAVEALDKAIEIDPQYSYALSLKESILLNSNKSLFSNSNMFVEEDDLLEYAQIYLKTYEDIINESNLTSDDLGLFSFYQNYPYSVNATISNTNGASVTFIPHSTDKSKVTKVPYPIEKLIPIINNEELNSPSIRGLSITGNSSNISIGQIFYGGNVSNISDMENYSIRDGFVYANNSSNSSLYKLTNAPIILGEGAHLNGITYIDSNNVFRKGELIFNGSLILNDSKVIMKSDLKKDWTKEKAEEDVIGFIYKEQIDRIFNYSKLTGIGYREIGKLVTDYKEKETTGYYETNSYARLRDANAIFSKADQYGIAHDSVLIELLNNKQEETSIDKIFSLMERFLTVIGIISLIKIKYIYQKLKKYFCKFFNASHKSS